MIVQDNTGRMTDIQESNIINLVFSIHKQFDAVFLRWEDVTLRIGVKIKGLSNHYFPGQKCWYDLMQNDLFLPDHFVLNNLSSTNNYKDWLVSSFDKTFSKYYFGMKQSQLFFIVKEICNPSFYNLSVQSFSILYTYWIVNYYQWINEVLFDLIWTEKINQQNNQILIRPCCRKRVFIASEMLLLKPRYNCFMVYKRKEEKWT